MRKVIVASIAAVAISFSGVSAATAAEATQQNDGVSSFFFGPEGFFGGSSESEDGKTNPKDVLAWINTITSIIKSLDTAFSFAV